jgi:hypothetical protein
MNKKDAIKVLEKMLRKDTLPFSKREHVKQQ